ncbi:hypothetical protein PL75_10505 [Neisseria arctica]|uniref:Cell division protein n=1 Tax=Neisseria arctica TaxID=1470200 RepID=A0A0J0YPE4_9NEIS|nr:hypothetical protein [Neisseria arctica]KLT72012.1 hypothetical protein PL75_10505 [Neisseria arctica]UOO86498.1 hypothetical protein LVJ86_09950 [Neisseria arctica]
MKWLFAVLVALNIIVFGGMVAGRVAEKQKAVVAPTVPVASGRQELAVPDLKTAPEVMASDDGRDAWITATEERPLAEIIAAADIPEGERQKLLNEEKQKEQQRREQERKAREERARREAEQEKQPEQVQAKPVQQCSASITLDEDDYHRIKGLLTQWPHAATRTVEQRSSTRAKTSAPAKSYRVLVPTGGDALARLDSLNAKGFSGTLHNGDISIGVVRSKSAAQVLVSRVAAAGFGGANVVEQEDKSSTVADSSLSVARMRVLFMSVDDKAAQGINAVVGNYGKLNRSKCK